MSFTVADLAAEFLERIGVTAAFGVVSVHNIPLLDAVARRNRVRVVPTRGEAGAAHMADGFARVSGGLGVVVSSTGPGAASAVAGLVEARFASTPVLHLAGQSKTAHLGRGTGAVHDVPDQLGMLTSAGKAAFRVPSPAEALGTLELAATAALTAPRGPVSVEIPIDIQRAEIARPDRLADLVLPVPPMPAPSTAALDRLEAMVRAARRPMLWLGNGAGDAGEAARALLDRGFCMVTSWNGRGLVPEDHPQSLGSLNGSGLPTVEAFYGTVDLMIVAGSRLRGHETAEHSVRLPARLVQVDIDPAADGRTYGNDLFVLGDAAATLAALARRLDGWAPEPGYTAEFTRMKERTRRAFRATLGPYAGFADQLRAAMPADAVWARDITISNSTWGNRLMPLSDPRANVYPVGAGIGQGLCLGIGAALAAARDSPARKTVCMTGDGGFFLNLGELWTAVQEQADMAILVMNDRGYGVIRHIQDATGAGRRFESFAAPALSEIAAAAGIPYRRVTAGGEFGPAAAEAIAHPGPALVEVDMTAIGAFPPYYPYGPRAEPVD